MSDAPSTFRDGRYRVVRVLGEGAQGTTFDAVDVKVGQAVAVKRFRVRGAKSWKEVELAEREARVLAGLSHPLLPRYVEHFEEGGELFLVTEKIEGESLAALRTRGVSFGEGDVRRLLRDAANALDYLHGRAPPIVHRDLKPGNVIRRPDGSFAFIDFGAVRDRMKPEGGSTVVGTFGFMAPEQFQGRAMPASDVYAIGATALSLLTGREPEELPHKGLGIDVAAALAGTPVSPAMVRALSAMLVPDPDERAQAIEPLLQDMGEPERADPAGDFPAERPGALRDSRPAKSFTLKHFLVGALLLGGLARVVFSLAKVLVGRAWLAGALGGIVILALACLIAAQEDGPPRRRPSRARPRRIRVDGGTREASSSEPTDTDEDETAGDRRTRRL